MNTLRKIANSAPVRRGKALLRQFPRTVTRLTSEQADFASHPPIIVNSLPKSGTHLLMQIANAFPQTRYYGSFIAQTPSLTLRERTQAQLNARIDRIVPGEVLGAHLYYSPETAVTIGEKSALHLFIWRDPRDVILSEAHYLAKMSKFHAMHRTFKALPDTASRVELAITGNGGRYLDIKERIGAYMGWIESPGCLSLRYEELVDPATQERECQRILDAYAQRCGGTEDLPSAVDLVTAISPEKSHTFNRGGIARWKSEMSEAHQAMCSERLGPWLDV